MTAAVAVATCTVLFLGGTGWADTDYVPEVMAPFVAPVVPGASSTVGVPYDAGMLAPTTDGEARLREALAAADGPVVVYGLSQGADVARAVRDNGEGLDPSRVSFVLVGDPGGDGSLRARLGMAPAPVVTPFDTTVVYGEYDMWADFPDRPWNLVAVANAAAGLPYVHMRYDDGVLDALPDATPTSVETNAAGGTTTTYRLPTERLPLVQPLRDLGVDERLVQRVEKPLRTVVDAGYSRNDAQTRERVREARSEVRKGVRSTVRNVRKAVRNVVRDAVRRPERARGGPAGADRPARAAAASDGDDK
ncbi:hydrolase [Mycobacterium phage LastHope]|uniref:Hydrolase n=1 Tax=Mycobacterium phage LastHope TaxID=2015886 RepID=A0A222ZS78_9CAUD|nr:DNA binding protein [Mycobacterium phage LastHope]ASR87249.1 hydrolase [Mycobacterium phage LastHope]